MVDLRDKRSPMILILVVIVIVFLVTASTLYYFTNSTASIQNTAVQSTNTTAQIQAADLARLMSNKLLAISSNLEVLSVAPPIISMNGTSGQQLLDKAQGTTSNYTSAYSQIDAAGTLLTSTNASNVGNLSQRDWFIGARNAGSTYVNPEFFSIASNQTYVVFSEPVYASQLVNGVPTKNFVGVLSAGVSFAELGGLVKGAISPQTQGTVGVIDYNGTILFGSSQTTVGKNIFDPAIQAQLPASIKTDFYRFINDSLKEPSVVKDFTYQGTTTALASQLITYGEVLGNASDHRVFAAVYFTTPSVLAASQLAQINQLQIFAGALIAGTVGTALVASVFVIRRNRTLSELVKERTATLEETNRNLEKSVEVAEKNRKNAELMRDILTHDIRNYNQVTKGNVELLQDRRSDEQSRRFLQAIENAVDGSTQLIQKTRLLANIVSGEDVALESTNLKQPLERAISLVKEAYPDKTIEMSSQEIPGDATVLADGLLDQVFVNVISNAVKYTTGNRVPIDVGVEKIEESEPGKSGGRKYWKVSIADHGQGIPDEAKALVSTRHLGTAKGRGLGLSIARALAVDRYSGKFELRNRVEGDYTKGTRVEIWLPMN